MASVNRVILVGNLGRDPEVRYTQSGQAVANFSMATTDNWTDKQGQKQERTEWHKIVGWGKTAELCGEYLCKGRHRYVAGRLPPREWNDKENHKNNTTEIVADRVVFLGSGQGGQRRSAAGGAGPDDFGPPPPGFDEPPSAARGGGAPSGGGSGGGGGQGGGGPSEEDIPF